MQAKISDFITLNDRMSDAYKNCPYYTGEKIADWKTLYLVQKHKDDFQFVWLHKEEKRLLNARRIHSFSSSQIIGFKEIEGRTIAITKLFVVDINQAIQHHEIKISQEASNHFFEEQRLLIIADELYEMLENVELGLITPVEYEHIAQGSFSHYFVFYQQKWRANYMISVTGNMHALMEKRTFMKD